MAMRRPMRAVLQRFGCRRRGVSGRKSCRRGSTTWCGHEEETLTAGYGDGFPVPLLKQWIDKIGF
jgi:hypothetical protein